MKLVQTALAVALLSGFAFTTPVEAQTEESLFAGLRALLEGPASPDDDADEDESHVHEGDDDHDDDSDDEGDDNDSDGGEDNDGGDDSEGDDD